MKSAFEFSEFPEFSACGAHPRGQKGGIRERGRELENSISLLPLNPLSMRLSEISPPARTRRELGELDPAPRPDPRCDQRSERRPLGGRVAGTPNPFAVDVMEQFEAFGCDPTDGMVRPPADGAVPLEAKARMFVELAGHVAPTRKAIEHGMTDGGFQIVLSPAEMGL